MSWKIIMLSLPLLFSAVVSHAEGVVLSNGEIKQLESTEAKAAATLVVEEVMIPWSNDVPKDWERENKTGYASFSNRTEESFDGTLHVTLGHAYLAEHLVDGHDCPAWVAELYKEDPKSLSRMHAGFKLKSQSDDCQRDIDRNNRWYKDAPNKTPQFVKEYRETDQYYRKKKAEYDSQFKMLRVKRFKLAE